ncbi:MAG: hypothetical protein ABI488_01535 [Polyangiaceae bacterium]
MSAWWATKAEQQLYVEEALLKLGELGDRDPATQLVTGAFAAPFEVLGGAGCNL